MKNVYEVLRQKELELARLEKEVEALRVAATLLSDEKEQVAEAPKPSITAAPRLSRCGFRRWLPPRLRRPRHTSPAGKTRPSAGRSQSVVAVERPVSRS